MYYIHVEITKWEVPNNSDGRKCYYRMFTYPHTIDKTFDSAKKQSKINYFCKNTVYNFSGESQLHVVQ